MPTDPFPVLELAPSGPGFAWSFEETKAFSFTVHNPGLPELASPSASSELRYTADVLLDGQLVRRIAAAPLPGPVPIGGTRTFPAHLGVLMIGGQYDLRFGLSRVADGIREGVPIPVHGRTSPFRVKNQIMEAFVELVNACNFRCTFCPQGELQRPQKPMEFALATKVVRELAEMGHHHPINVHLLGEPLLYKRFFEFVAMAHDHGQRIQLVTNGSRFQQANIDGILRTGVDELVISLNTPEKEKYLAERGTDMPYEEYMDGIRRMVAAAARHGGPPKVLIQVLYHHDRLDGPEIARVNAISHEWANVVQDALGLPISAPDDLQLFTPPFTKVSLGDNIGMQYMPYHQWGEGGRGDKAFCSYPWRQFVVLVDGQATTCCVDAEGEINLGNAYENTVEELWEGPLLNSLRRAFWNDLQAQQSRCVRCDIRHWDLEATFRNHVMK